MVLGNIYRNWGDFDKAKEAYDKSIEIGEQEEHIGGLSPRYNNRGLLFLSEEKWTEAMSDFDKAIKIDKEMGDKIIEKIKEAEKDEGIDSEKLIMELQSPPEIINQEIKKLLEEGIIYEPRPGRLRYLG